jgi:TPR repeat protein
VYDDGALVARDEAQALAWYQQSAFNPRPDDKRPHALLALARKYDAGGGATGGKADPAKALAYYKSAAVAGHPAAQNALATYFYEGSQVKQDLGLARKLFLAAAQQGDSEAMKNAGVMLFKGEGGGADLLQSYVWLRLAERLGDAQAPAMAKLVEKRLSAEQRTQAEAVLQPKSKG